MVRTYVRNQTTHESTSHLSLQCSPAPPLLRLQAEAEKATGQADTTLSVWSAGVSAPLATCVAAKSQDPPLSLRIRSAAKPSSKAVRRPIAGLLRLGSLSKTLGGVHGLKLASYVLEYMRILIACAMNFITNIFIIKDW